MERVGIRQLRANASAFLGRAQAGERIVITVGGRSVAQLGPIDPQDGAPTLHDLAARGLVIAPRRDDRPEPTFVMPTWTGTRLDNIVREIRGR